MPKLFPVSKETIDDIDLLRDNFGTLPTLKISDTDCLHPDNSIINYHNFDVDAILFKKVLFVAVKFGLSPSAIFAAAFKALLHRYSGQDDIFLTQLAVESQQNKAVGYRPVLCRFDEETSFSSLLQLTHNGHFTNIEMLTLEDIGSFLNNIQVGVEIFQAFIVYKKHDDMVEKAVVEEAQLRFPNFTIGLFVNETTEGIKCELCYNEQLFSTDFIAAFQQQYLMLLAAVVNSPETNISAHQILTPKQWQSIVVDFNNTIVPYPVEKTLFGLFEERVAIAPNNIALRKGEKTLTYDELNRLSNRFAHSLIANGVQPQDNIGLLATRDFEMMIGMLGILKAGGAYVPIDPDYPVDRQEYIYRQSSLKLVLADNNYPLKSLLAENKYLKIDAGTLADFADTNPNLPVSSRQLAYIIYTSGSTGRPKGVMIAHHSAVNLVAWVNKTYNIGSDDNLLFITSMCFDLSVYDIFGILAAGGSVVIATQEQIQDVKQLQRMLIDYNITFWDSVPTTLDYLIRNLELTEPNYSYSGLKTIFLSGDWIAVDLPERIKKFLPNAAMISLGGATEGTVWSNFFPVNQTQKRWKSIPYGKPIDNNFFYILNEQLQPAPIGVVGDLYIGGAGVARGYAGDKDKTDSAFVPDPFNQQLGGLMYKTGDLGRMGPDMNMEFVGRKDNQVKILGFRIELGEIESVLNSSDQVASAVVLAKNDSEGKKRLIAYVVSNGIFDKDALASYLKTKLPHYMVPAIWISLDYLPLTSNGKIDRNSLPDVVEKAPAKQASLPATAIEKTLKDIWQNCMGLKDISIDDNFFELGGHSLIAAQILSLFKNETGHDLQLAVLFQYPDIRSLAKFIDGDVTNEEIAYTCLVPIKPTGTKPPLYVIHGEGLNVLKFSALATIIDADQPIWGLQARGLNGLDQPMDDMKEIAQDYLREILLHNPYGPYILGGYSFGGYVAVEIQKLLEEMGKEVPYLIMFDTDAERLEKKKWYKLLPMKIARNVARLPEFISSNVSKKNIIKPEIKLSRKETAAFYRQIKKIQLKHMVAFNNYKMTEFNARVCLFRAKISVHYVDDKKYLGWTRFAKKGVDVYEVPGDHRSMLEYPHVNTLAALLQKKLDEQIAQLV